MSGRTEPPDWLDELYQEGSNEGPPASVDARIGAAARGQLSARPWYLRARSLASAATIILGLGITALWMSEPDLAELAVPSTQGTSAELREAVQSKKRQLQTSASDELREEDEIDASVSSIQASTPSPQAAAPAELKFQSETANAAADSEPEAANLSAARSPLASTADFDHATCEHHETAHDIVIPSARTATLHAFLEAEVLSGGTNELTLLR